MFEPKNSPWSQEQKAEFVELALCSASVADTIGMIFANVLGLMVPRQKNQKAMGK
jgi:hypothetical protein